MNDMRLLFQLFNVILLLALLVLLQIFLSTRKSRVPGMILPVIFFGVSLLVPLNMAVPQGGVTAGFIVQIITVFLLANIPTAVLLAVYFGCRKKNGKIKEIDKMNIQDLG